MAVNSFVTAAEYPCDGPELGLGLDITLGRAGILLACSSLLGVLPAKAKAGEDLHEPLRALGRRMLSDIWGKLDRFPPISDSKELSLLGIAHGWAGLLYATMCWCALPGNPIPSGLSERLEQLAECAEPAGRGMQWKWDFARSASEPGGGSAPGWCNGSAGYVYLWTQAHMGFAEPGFLQLAEGAAWNAWETRHGTGDLCCGLAGQAYALLNLYRHTGEAVWLRRACDLSRNAAEAAAYASSRESREQPAPRPESLYKGELGIIVLDSDLNQPEFARMPMFESEA
jgi:serine/threonine-protein kinase